MINTILFDLDGTLLSIDTEEFIKNYFYALGSKLEDYFSPKEVYEYFWQSTKYMISNTDPKITNEEAFFQDFQQHTEDLEEINVLLEEFYEKDFNQLKELGQSNDDMLKAVKILKEKGYKLVIATNPLFPRSAILNRIAWAKLNLDDFDFVTSFEHMHFCKPQIQYYKEVLENIDKKPSECLMVGNDVNEDMVSKEIGVKTYLIENNIIGKVNDNVDHKGKYKDFFGFVKSLPKL